MLGLLVGLTLMGQNIEQQAIPNDPAFRQSHGIPVRVTNKAPVAQQPVVSPKGTSTSEMISATQIGQASNVFTTLSSATNAVSWIPGDNFISAIYRQNIGPCGGQSGNYRYSFSSDNGANWNTASGATGGCYGFGPINPAYTQNGRYPNMYAYQTGTGLADIKLIYSGATFPVGGSLPWTGNKVGTITDPTNFVAANVVQEDYPMANTPDEGSFVMAERQPGEYWIPSESGNNINLWKGTYNAATGVVDWAVSSVLTPNHNTVPSGASVLVGMNMAWSPDGQTGYVAWLGDLVGGLDSTLTPCYANTTDGGLTWSTPEAVDLSEFRPLIDSIQSFWITTNPTTNEVYPASCGIPTTGFDLDMTVDKNGNPHLLFMVGSAAFTDENTGECQPIGNPYSIFSGLRNFHYDFTLINGNWTGIFIGSNPTFRGDFGDGTDALGIDPYTQVSRNAAGDKVFLHYTDTDTTGNFGSNDNLFPDLLGRAYNVNTGMITPLTNWTAGDPNWTGAAITPTMSPIAIDSAGGLVNIPTMVAELTTNGFAATNYWYFNNITYDTTDINEMPSLVENCNASSLAAAPVPASPDCGATNGSIMAGASGGNGPYTYLWNTGSTDAMISGLGAGTYSVLVTDNSGCTVEETILLESNAAGAATVTTPMDISCAGANDGMGSATITGGTAPYSFDWNNGLSTDSTATNLPAGESVVTITDANGCVSFASVTLSEPAAIIVTSVVNGSVACEGDTDGQVSIAAQGGTGNLSFAWDGGSTDATASDLGPGTFNVTITDANGCTVDTSATVAPATPLTPALSAPVPNGPFTDGVISINFDGAGSPGNGPDYTINVRLVSVLGNEPASGGLDSTFTSSDPNSAELVGVCGGTYEVTVTDVAGCVTTDSVDVNADEGFYCDSTSVGILDDLGINDLQVYPNPNSGMFEVELETSSAMDVNLTVMNAQGQIIENRNERVASFLQTQFDLSGEAKGIYLLRVSTPKGAQTMQVMVQ